MQLNSLFFPVPNPQYSATDFPGSLTYIQHSGRKVPCCLERGKSNIWMLYFHGNSQDLNGAFKFMQLVKKATEIDYNFLAVEYPGYGIYTNYEPTEETIKQDANAAFEFILEKDPHAQVFLIGRSMGTGPACFLASQNKATGVILISPYSSFKKIAKDYVGFLSVLVKDRFKNSEMAKNITIPALLIHGKADDVISFSHSQKIYKKLRSVHKNMYISENMTHNKYDMVIDICDPIANFLEAILN